MKLTFLVVLLLSPFLCCAQQDNVEVSDLVVRYRSLEDFNRPPVSVKDSLYDKGNVEMEVSFTLSDAKKIKGIDIKTGEQNGSSELLNKSGTCMKEGNKYYFVYNNTAYEIQNNRVSFTEVVTEGKMKKAAYFTVHLTDNQNNKSVPFTQKIK